ncbi:MAG: AAA family ATPase [Clostridia bacterium]|nr:AAA family ATPase [Clostridia bacterium]
METGRNIAIGTSDFKGLLSKGCYYIDKTLYIKRILDNKSEVALITRPRRFGKTLNMSMLKYFFSITQNSEELFADKKIMQAGEEYTSKMNSYPVIYLTLKDVADPTYEDMIRAMKTAIYDMYQDHLYLLESDKVKEFEKDRIKDILWVREDVEAIKVSVKELSKYLYNQYEKKVIVLIDEYDVPIQNAYVKGYYDKAIDFFKLFFRNTFKDNPYMEKTVLTGVSRVSKESLFSGANNFDVFTILSDEFSEDFGITEQEMQETIKHFGIEEDEENLKKWYDGYRIGNTENIYNPWNVLNYLAKNELKPYWVNTSSNDLIKLVLKKSLTVKEKIERLLNGEEVEVLINEETVINGIENNENNIWGLMLGTGYLKVIERIEDNVYKVAIPNYEIKYLFYDIVRTWFSDKVPMNDLRSILKDLTTLNMKEFEEKFKILVRQMFSFMDVGENVAENFYHAFVLGMLVGLRDTYYVNSNRESGMGRYDIMLEPKDKSANSFIMEFKVYKEDDENTIEDTLNNAMRQIEERQYESNLRERGFENITKMVFAFKGKEFKMKVY